MWLIFSVLAVMINKRAMRPPPTCDLADHRLRHHHDRKEGAERINARRRVRSFSSADFQPAGRNPDATTTYSGRGPAIGTCRPSTQATCPPKRVRPVDRTSPANSR